MDIGDPSEIPTTRKKLPSMQELGAFELHAAEPTPAPPAAPAAAPAAPAAPAAQGIGKPARRPTPQQFRVALERADPATRKKLLRLIAGGQVVGRLDEQAAGESRPAHPLDMTKRVSPNPVAAPAARQPPHASIRQAERPIASLVSPSGKKLLQIDANTELLEAVPPPLSAEQRQAELQAQLAAASQSHETPRSEAAAAHKVLFPAYDPRQHGDDVRRPTRRADAPVEGHFPAPRQPFQARYQHADGRPMNEEETQVEVVLQQERCEKTLEVLARDGVNGLLLSPRDLDAAVENGTLDEPTAALLWKTWSALRPVIHVIDDEPPQPVGENDASEDKADAASAQTAQPSATRVDCEMDAVPGVEPEAGVSTEIPSTMPSESPELVESKQIAAETAWACAEPARSAPPAAAENPAESNPQIVSLPAAAEPPPHTTQTGRGRRSRLRQLQRLVLFAVVGLSVLHSAAQFSSWAWLRWGAWLIR